MSDDNRVPTRLAGPTAIVPDAEDEQIERAFGLVMPAGKCQACKGTGQHVPGRCPLDATPCAQCGGTGKTMADKLDAAGIR